MMQFIKFNQLEIQSSLEYWTDERIAKAIPISLPQVEIFEGIQQKSDEGSKSEPEMSFCGATRRIRSKVSRADVTIDPYTYAGKLYLKRNNRDCWGSAQFVGVDNILITAAHCIKVPDGEWSENIIFYRTDIDGKSVQKLAVSVVEIGVHCGWD